MKPDYCMSIDEERVWFPGTALDPDGNRVHVQLFWEKSESGVIDDFILFNYTDKEIEEVEDFDDFFENTVDYYEIERYYEIVDTFIPDEDNPV